MELPISRFMYLRLSVVARGIVLRKDNGYTDHCCGCIPAYGSHYEVFYVRNNKVMLVCLCTISTRMKRLQSLLHTNFMFLAVLALHMELNLPNICVFKSHHINKEGITLHTERVL